LSNCRDAVHVAVSAGQTLVDPEHVVQEQLIADPALLFDLAGERVAPPGPGRQAWLQAHRDLEKRAVAELRECIAENTDFSAPRMWHALGALLPDGCGLYFSSSMLVRHLDTFMSAHGRDLDIHFNRGLNGIDGVVSTASGIAAGRGSIERKAPTVLVIGDVALRHDATALLIALEMKLDLTVIVVDNDGGEIFEYLPSAGFGEVHRKHFATSGATPVSRAIPRGIDMLEPSDWSDFDALVTDSISAGGLRVIRFPTSRRLDHKLRGELIARVSGRLDRIVQSDEDNSRPGA
jgi:2-succinyl-5-enolpyruvyl-6-hydroxy-3-cyclohexene-1-carboxylate synthase